MITTKYNFKQYVRKKYPDVSLTPVYGTSAYVLDKELDSIDMYEYNVQQLTNGHYIVFIGVNYTERHIRSIMANINNTGLHQSKKPLSPYAPTTFSAFEHYIQQKDITPIHRTHIQDQTANEALFTNNEQSGWNTKRNWYMYELPMDALQPNPASPYTTTESGTIVLLIKCATSAYISKRKLFLQKFQRMQPIYEQVVAACAKEEWEQAATLCGQYASIQFEFEAVVKDIEAMKESYANGTLRLYTRDIENFEMAQNDETL